MKKLNVSGYPMKKNSSTGEMERAGNMVTIPVSVQSESIMNIECTIAIQQNFDWFEAVTIEPAT